MPITISLLTLYNQDESILNSTNFPLPTGMDHEILDPLLLAETAELEILYPEPTTLKTVIKAWARARQPAWERMLSALTVQYNPIHNYDRTESWTDTHNLTNSREFHGTTTESTETSGTVENSGTVEDSGSSSNTGTSETTGSSTDTGTVAGYNSTDWTNKDKQAKSETAETETSGSVTTSSSTETSGTSESSETGSKSGTNDYADTSRDTGTLTRAGSVSGNIGVTTNQQMIQAELELRQLDMCRIVINEFIKMFCLGVF